MAIKMTRIVALVALALVASASARPLGAGEVQGASAPAPAAAPSHPAAAKQLDICSLTRTPSMFLEVADEVCTITSRVLPANGTADGALRLTFPCAPASESKPAKLEGPALNVWATATPAADAAAGSCSLTTLNPVLYFHRQAPPLFHYGYSLSGLSCSQGPASVLQEKAKAAVATASPASGPVGVVYGLNLVPALPSPSQAHGAPLDAAAAKFFSTAPQQCRLAVTAMGRSYMFQSKEAFPCSMVVDPEKALGAGRCFGGAPAH